ncbi:MAG: tRNA preQ1(34) S-adenosylmethionine ribosyltransferase-isomerase QueA [bacterium]
MKGKGLAKSDFYYFLPPHLIAQRPAPVRSLSRLMVLLPDGRIEHRIFEDIVEYLGEGDVLVINDTRVIPARLVGRKSTGGGVELLLLRQLEGKTWEVRAERAKRLRAGAKLVFGDGLRGKVVGELDEGRRIVEFSCDGDFYGILDGIGRTPLPPYIKRSPSEEDRDRYQTVYAKHPGSVAAPTAGLHFTRELMGKLEDRGVRIVPVTLHVGLGTFAPVRVDRIEEHRMHSEAYSIPEESARVISSAERVVAVGTTVTRVLEAVFRDEGEVVPKSGWTDLFIYPPYEFGAVDALITNFHLPESTLLMLVCAFGGYERVMGAYREAIEREYRFYSYGDAMMIFPACRSRRPVARPSI